MAIALNTTGVGFRWLATGETARSERLRQLGRCHEVVSCLVRTRRGERGGWWRPIGREIGQETSKPKPAQLERPSENRRELHKRGVWKNDLWRMTNPPGGFPCHVRLRNIWRWTPVSATPLFSATRTTRRFSVGGESPEARRIVGCTMQAVTAMNAVAAIGQTARVSRRVPNLSSRTPVRAFRAARYVARAQRERPSVRVTSGAFHTSLISSGPAAAVTDLPPPCRSVIAARANPQLATRRRARPNPWWATPPRISPRPRCSTRSSWTFPFPA